jgi:hypothetical protein
MKNDGDMIPAFLDIQFNHGTTLLFRQTDSRNGAFRTLGRDDPSSMGNQDRFLAFDRVGITKINQMIFPGIFFCTPTMDG